MSSEIVHEGEVGKPGVPGKPGDPFKPAPTRLPGPGETIGPPGGVLLGKTNTENPVDRVKGHHKGVQIQCPHCNGNHVTKVHRKVSTMQWVCCLCFCCIPCCVPPCYVHKHYCGGCGKYIGDDK